MGGDRAVDDNLESDEMLEAELAAALWEAGIVPQPRRERPKTDWTVDELYDAVLPEPRWVVRDLLPTGLASLAGRPKLGKSWLALQLAAAVARGAPFLERDVQEGRVIFIALEDPPRRLCERVGRLGVWRGAPIQFYTTWPTINKEGGLEELELTVAEWQPLLVVIDTLARAFDRRTEWNSVGEATGALAGLQRLAHEHNCCVLTVDHHKKPGLMANVVDDILGSTGKAAVLDTAWGLYKDRSAGSATLRVTGRDLMGCELALRFSEVTHEWEVRGTSPPAPLLMPEDASGEGSGTSRPGRLLMAEDGSGEGSGTSPPAPLLAHRFAPGEGWSRVAEEERVARALQELGGVSTTEEMAQGTGMAKSNVSRALRKLVAGGRVRRLGREGNRVPYEWVG